MTDFKDEWHKVNLERKFLVCCPFHQELTPSCVIDPMTETFHCFGCGVEGNIKDFPGVAKLMRVASD